MKKISLLCIGNELIDGTTQDKNLFFLGKYLENMGFSLQKAIFCSDDHKNIKDHLTHNDDLLILSGGLGPTEDDLTKSAIASALNLDLTYSDEALEIIKKQFDLKSKPYIEKNYHYHLIPKDFIAVYNPTGFAPGLYSKTHKLLLLPGVPREFSSMIESFLPNLLTQNTLQEKFIFRTHGVPEITIFRELAPKLWEKLSLLGEVSSLPQDYGVDIGVKIQSDSLDELKEKKSKIERIIKNSNISNIIWGQGLISIQEIIHNMLLNSKQTIASAESCTSGMIAQNLTKYSGSSAYFQGSLVAYQNHLKTSQLKVSQDMIEQYGVVSKEVSEAMAQNIREKFQTDYAISTTGHLDFQGETPPHVWISISSKNSVDSKFFKYHKDRDKNKIVFTELAFHFLKEILEK